VEREKSRGAGALWGVQTAHALVLDGRGAMGARDECKALAEGRVVPAARLDVELLYHAHRQRSVAAVEMDEGERGAGRKGGVKDQHGDWQDRMVEAAWEGQLPSASPAYKATGGAGGS